MPKTAEQEPLNSRISFDEPIELHEGDTLRVTYTLTDEGINLNGAWVVKQNVSNND